MPLSKFVIVSAVAAVAAGCCWRPKHASTVEKASIFQPDYRWGELVPQPDEPLEIVPASAIDDLPNVDTFTIEFRAFDATLPTSGSTIVSERLAASQSVTIITDALKDEDGLLEGSVASEGGRPSTKLLGILFGNEAPYKLIVDSPVRLGPHKVAIRLRTSNYTKPGIFNSASDGIQWSVTVTIDGEYAEPRFSAMGGWSGAHAAELVINDVRVYRQAATVHTTPKDPKAKESEDKKISWSDFLFTASKLSATHDGIRVNGLLPKPEYRP